MSMFVRRWQGRLRRVTLGPRCFLHGHQEQPRDHWGVLLIECRRCGRRRWRACGDE